jgi:hypothetical protein
LKLFERQEGDPVVRLGILIHKVAFVMNKDKSVIWLKNRRLDSSTDQFQCYGVETSSKATAKQLAQHIVATCNSVFRKLRRTRKKIKGKAAAEGKDAPKTDSMAAPSTQEAERLRSELQAGASLYTRPQRPLRCEVHTLACPLCLHMLLL